METLLEKENRQEAEELLAFVENLNPEKQRDFLIFVQGVRFAEIGKSTAAEPA